MIKQSENILIFQPIVPAYRVPIFREMHRRFGTILCHSDQQKTSKIDAAKEAIDYPNEVIAVNTRFGTSQKVRGVLKKYRPKIVIAGVAVTNLTFLKLLLLRPFFGYKLIAWGHGVTNREINKPLAGYRGKIMRWYFKKSDALVFYSGKRKALVEEQLPKLKPKMFVAWNTLDTSSFKCALEKLETQGKEKVKQELGQVFSRRFNLIFVGRLLPDKGIPLLLEAIGKMSDSNDVALHFIGKGSLEETITSHSLYGKTIFSHGAIYDDSLTAKYLYASDLFVMPGYVGLSVIHAFALGLPVLTCSPTEKGPFHSPEFEYLEDNKNAFIVKSNVEEIIKSINIYLNSEKLQKSMRQNALKAAYKECTLNCMMDGFYDAIQNVC